MKDLTVVTACFWDNDSKIKDLATSCKMSGVDLNYYGVKKIFTSWYQAKVEELIPFLRTLPYDYVLYVDGFDSLILTKKKKIMENFFKYDQDVVLSAEKNCYPLEDYIDMFNRYHSGYSFPCAGGFMGKRTVLIDILESFKKYQNIAFSKDKPLDYNRQNDQAYWQMAYLKGDLDNIARLDVSCHIFANMGGESPSDVLERTTHGYKHKQTGSHPNVIHFNGPKGGSDNEKNQLLFTKEFLKK